MFDEYRDILEEQRDALIKENEELGIRYPFLVKMRQGAIVAAKLIPTRRDDRYNVCFACVKPNIQPNGIFLAYNDEEVRQKYGLEIKLARIYVATIRIESSKDGFPKLVFAPSAQDYQHFFDRVGAFFVNDLRVLENMR